MSKLLKLIESRKRRHYPANMAEKIKQFKERQQQRMADDASESAA